MTSEPNAAGKTTDMWMGPQDVHHAHYSVKNTKEGEHRKLIKQ
jgi:hypothetical protein